MSGTLSFRKNAARLSMLPEKGTENLKKPDWFLIGACWLLTQLLSLYYLGINAGEESIKYIDLADKWIRGGGHYGWYNLFYSGYTAIHVLLRMAGFPVKSMYIIQLLLSAAATYYFIRILCLYSRSRKAILIAGILYSTCFIIQQWVSALFTDSAFSSLLIIALYFLLTQEKSKGNRIIFWALLILLPTFRPVGFLFILLACCYWIFISVRKNVGKLIFCSVYLLLIGFVIDRSLTQSPAYFYPFHNIQANVICGYPGNLLQYRKVPYQEGMSIFSYLLENPGMTIRLFFNRFFKIFSMTRDYFSTKHNLLLVATTGVYYILAFIGALRIIFRKQKEKYFLLAGLLLFSIPSVIFCVDWSGRFSLPVLCFVLLLSGIGLDGIFKIKQDSKRII